MGCRKSKPVILDGKTILSHTRCDSFIFRKYYVINWQLKSEAQCREVVNYLRTMFNVVTPTYLYIEHCAQKILHIAMHDLLEKGVAYCLIL
jgi:hypothetical protein